MIDVDEENRRMCEDFLPEQRFADKLKLNYLNSIDIDVCSYVKNQVFYCDFDLLTIGKKICLDDLIELSFEEMMIFDNTIIDRLRELVKSVEMNTCYDDFSEYSCNIGYTTNIYNRTVQENSGRVLGYNIPKKYFEYYTFTLVHEHIHALKETNYNEYKNVFTLGETIPIFMELLMFDSIEEIRRNVLRERLCDIFTNGIEFDIVNKYVLGNNSKSIYEYVRTTIGCYLNSFYYAVILYSMYKETPKKILDLVSKVLKHEMTTLDMLKKLNLYGDIRGEIFEKELGMIKKLVK